MLKPYGLVFLLSTLPVQAGQITTDGSMGAAITLTGPNYTIPQSFGITVGNNLFQSFENFSLSQGDIATFTGASSLQNVISRVTGGTVSNIDGTLRSQVGNANFFFINPAGVIFGKNASVDVPSGFYVSTAQELRFSDGTKYSATLPNGSLTSAPPEAFGFLGKTGDIQIENGKLFFKDDSNITLAGGSITSNNSKLIVPQGNLRVYGQGDSVSAVPISGDLPAGNGVISLNGSTWDLGGNGGGNLDISGGSVNINNTTILNNNLGDQNSTMRIQIDANTLKIESAKIYSDAYSSGNSGSTLIHANTAQINNSEIGSSVFSSGAAGNVLMTINGVLQMKNTLIVSETLPTTTGNAGNILMTVLGQINMVGGEITTNTWAKGNAGNLTITAHDLTIDSAASSGSLIKYAFIDSTASLTSTGQAGNVTITVIDNLNVINGGHIESDTWGSGNAGNLTLTARNLRIEGATGVSAGVSTDTNMLATGQAGNIVITVANEMQVLNGGTVSSNTSSSGNAGSVSVTTGNLIIRGGQITGISSDANTGSSGQAGDVTVIANHLNIDGGQEGLAYISSDTMSTGKAGHVTVNVAEDITLLHTSWISSATYDQGDAGTVTIKAGSLIMDSGVTSSMNGTIPARTAQISSRSAKGIGNAGNVQIDITGDMQVLNGAAIMSSTKGSGAAGNVTVKANTLTLDGKQAGITLISSSTSSTGHAGTVAVFVNHEMQIRNGGEIDSISSGTGSAGTVTINAERLMMQGKNDPSISATGIATSAEGSGNAGDVKINITGELQILNGAQISSGTWDIAPGGNVFVTAGSLIIDGKNSMITSQASNNSTGQAGTVTVNVTGNAILTNSGTLTSQNNGKGNAGQVNLSIGGFLNVEGGEISSSATTGKAGSIQIKTPLLTLNNGQITTSVLGGQGMGGEIVIKVDGTMQIINGGEVSSNTFGAGEAGTVTVLAKNLMINKKNGSSTGIFSEASKGSSGNAGKIILDISKDIVLLNGGQVSSSTFGSGNAGSVTIYTTNLIIDGQGSQADTYITSEAYNNSTGNAGNVSIHVGNIMDILNTGQISSENLGTGNAGTVEISVGNRLNITNSSITTAAQTGNGGPIFVHVPLLVMANGQITTSVSGDKGDGGNITISGDYLIMDTGFIQANTAAHGAKGGNIFLDELGIIGNGNTVALGGQKRETYVPNSGKNVIQAAAQDGMSGSVTLSSPNAASNAGFGFMSGNRAELKVAQNPCKYRKKASLHIKGRGGLPAKILDNVLSTCNKS